MENFIFFVQRQMYKGKKFSVESIWSKLLKQYKKFFQEIKKMFF